MTPANSQWVSVYHEFSKTPRKIMDFKNQLYQRKITPRKGGLRHTQESTPQPVEYRGYMNRHLQDTFHIFYIILPFIELSLGGREHLLTHKQVFLYPQVPAMQVSSW